MQITAHTPDNSVHVSESGQRSEPAIKMSNASALISSVGITEASQTLRTTIQFETLIDMEPDIETPKTIADLAQEQHEFLSSVQGKYVDIDLPLEN